MKQLFSFILFLGVCCSHWTTVTPLKTRWHILRILKSAAECNATHESMRYKNMVSIADQAFNDCSNLKSLDLSHNLLKDLTPRLFSKLKNLENLSLKDNNISSISEPFVGLNNLKHLDLSYNWQLTLEAGALFGLNNSTDIITKKSLIQYISSMAFLNPSGLEVSRELSKESEEDSEEDPPASSHNPNVKICKTDDGLVTSIQELKPNEPIGNCTAVIVNVDYKFLNLTNLGLKGFQHGWYQLADNFFKILDLTGNLISDITPELLNHLPSNLTDFYFDQNNISSIKRNVIENSFAKSLSFLSNPLSQIEDGAFEKTNLLYLTIGDTKLENISFVKTLPTTIEELEIFRSPISELPVDTFRGLKNLKMIRINDTNIDKIEPGTFEDQKNLEYLYLDSNQIEELNPGIFKDIEALSVISFENNTIEKISKDTFSELRNSSGLQIYLDLNRINIIEEGTFSNMNIDRLRLRFNKIADHSIAEGTFDNSTVKYIDLEGNLITKINSKLFGGILSSYELDLRNNQIKTIKHGDAEKMRNCSSLFLNENPLKRLENGALHGLSKEKNTYVYLVHSPIELIQGGLFDDV